MSNLAEENMSRGDYEILPSGVTFLAPFLRAGVIEESDLHLAAVIERRQPGVTEPVLLAAALCLRALRRGSCCIRLDDIVERIEAELLDQVWVPPMAEFGIASVDEPACTLKLDWPDRMEWAELLRRSDVVDIGDPVGGETVHGADGITRPLVFDGERLYLERYWAYERLVGNRLVSSDAIADDDVDQQATRELAELVGRYFRPDGHAEGHGGSRQQDAVQMAMNRGISVIAGGPGTGKTYTIARLLGVAIDSAKAKGRRLNVMLAAPTGKAAARMSDAIARAIAGDEFPESAKDDLVGLEAVTLHRLLGINSGGAFTHGVENPLSGDLIVVDEASMVGLPLMAALFKAVRPGARLVLVGDPYQLASVDVGTVLADIVGHGKAGVNTSSVMNDKITVLDEVHRYDEDSDLGELAKAVREQNADVAIEILRSESPNVHWMDTSNRDELEALGDDVGRHAALVVNAANKGDLSSALARLNEMKVLCGTRFGQWGTAGWESLIDRRVHSHKRRVGIGHRFYLGQPIMVTRNQYDLGVMNGDTGIVIDDGGKAAVLIGDGIRERKIPIAQLESIESWWTMTIHKSQGSEFDRVIVSLPDARSPVLTNELVYTAITRAKEAVSIVATEDALRAAISKPVMRASGLGDRLWSAWSE